MALAPGIPDQTAVSQEATLAELQLILPDLEDFFQSVFPYYESTQLPEALDLAQFGSSATLSLPALLPLQLPPLSPVPRSGKWLRSPRPSPTSPGGYQP